MTFWHNYDTCAMNWKTIGVCKTTSFICMNVDMFGKKGFLLLLTSSKKQYYLVSGSFIWIQDFCLFFFVSQACVRSHIFVPEISTVNMTRVSKLPVLFHRIDNLGSCTSFSRFVTIFIKCLFEHTKKKNLITALSRSKTYRCHPSLRYRA